MAPGIEATVTGMRLQAALLSAHALDDRAALVELYSEAAKFAEAEQDIGRACFFLTHAWIFALETDHEMRDVLRDKLALHGRV